MPVKYVLFVICCAVPLLLHVAESQEHCKLVGDQMKYAYCTPKDANRTFDYIPIISDRITYLNMNEQPLKQLPRNAFGNITSKNELTWVTLSNCQIQHIDADAFVNLVSLKYLYMQANNISRFETGTFQHTKRLVTLYVRANNLDRLQTGLFHNLVHLEEVTFEHNRIACIGQDTFRNTSLSYIDVDYNELEYLSPLFTDNFVNITRLLVRGNSWNCDCNLKEFYEKNKARKRVYNDSAPKCQNPPALRGRKWTDLTSEAFNCDARIILPKNDTRVVTVGSNVTLPCAVHGDHGNASSTDEDNA